MKLFMLIGVAGCGKTTASNILHKLIPNSVIISFDGIRKEEYGDISILGDYEYIKSIARKQLVDAVSKNIDVIFDSPNTNKVERKHFIDKFKHEYKISNIVGIWVDTPFFLCKERNLSRHDRREPVLDKHLYSMRSGLEKYAPTMKEGFSELHHLEIGDKTPTELEEIYKDII